MVNAAGELELLIGNIRDVEKEQGSTISLVATKQKRETEELMVVKCVKVGNALYVIGVDTHNVNLMELSVINARSFASRSDNEKLALANRIYDMALANSKPLADYTITGEEIDSLHSTIDAYSHLISSPMNIISSHKEKTERLKLLFDDLDKLLVAKLDRLIVLFNDSSPSFYIEYQSSRNIINTATRHQKETEE